MQSSVLETYRRWQDPVGKLAELRERLRFCVDLNFFGACTRVCVASDREFEQWRYFYKSFVAPCDRDPMVTVFLEVEGVGGDSFIESIFRKDFSKKAIWVYHNGDLFLWSRFDRWSSMPSPVPPFMFPPLADQLIVYNASSVIAPHSTRSIALAAPPYQGKSTLLNALVLMGGRPLADNMTVYDRRAHKLLPYLTPSGIRAETLDMLPHLREAVTELADNWITISEVTGKVYLMHMDEIRDFAPPEPSEPAVIVFPRDERAGTDAEPVFTRLTAEALTKCLQSQLLYPAPSKADTGGWSRLLDVPAYELRYSLKESDLNQVCNRLIELVG